MILVTSTNPLVAAPSVVTPRHPWSRLRHSSTWLRQWLSLMFSSEEIFWPVELCGRLEVAVSFVLESPNARSSISVYLPFCGLANFRANFFIGLREPFDVRHSSV